MDRGTQGGTRCVPCVEHRARSHALPSVNEGLSCQTQLKRSKYATFEFVVEVDALVVVGRAFDGRPS